MVDPIDKNPSLVKSVLRACEYIHTFFKEKDSSV